MALTSRKNQGMTAIEPALLQTLCNISQGGGQFPVPSDKRSDQGIREEMCRDIDIDDYVGLGVSVIVNTCDLGWEPRLMEDTIARCVEAQVCPL